MGGTAAAAPALIVAAANVPNEVTAIDATRALVLLGHDEMDSTTWMDGWMDEWMLGIWKSVWVRTHQTCTC
jgi:hypothetical protein